MAYILGGFMVIPRNNDILILASHAGFSVNHGTIQHWTIDVSYRAIIRELIDDMTYYKKVINIHHDMSPKRIQRDEEDVKTITDDINKNFTFPFIQWRFTNGENSQWSSYC